MADELQKRSWRYHSLYFTHWAGRNLPNNTIVKAWEARQNKKAVKKIELIIKKSAPDIIITNTMVAPWASIAAKNLNIPHVWFVREYGGLDSNFSFLLGRRKTYDVIDALSDLIVANSVALAKYISAYVDNSKVSVLYTPFNIPEIRKLSQERIENPYKSADSLKLVIIGRIAPSKGQDVVAEAVGILKNKGINFELCIVGSSSNKNDERRLREVIEEYGIGDSIHLVGHRLNPLPYISLADIGVMASEKEGFGRTTFEYMALGKAVVGANSGATPELIDHNVNGFLFRLGDAKSLANELLKYAKNMRLCVLHGSAAHKKSINMMSGANSAEELFKKIEYILESRTGVNNEQGYSAEWLNVSRPHRQFFKNRGIGGLPEWVYISIRLLLKTIYLYIK